jgi:hypothetical protein
MLMFTSHVVPRVCGLHDNVNCALSLAARTLLVPESSYSHLHLPMVVLLQSNAANMALDEVGSLSNYCLVSFSEIFPVSFFW